MSTVDLPGWNAAWRMRALPELAACDWDLIVVGGGISGAGILREAARRGWKCLLIEQRDFAWGTSSRSSKMVHGGLRYIAKGQLGLTRDSVRERQRLLSEAPGLVDPLSFLFPHYQGAFPGPRVFGGLLALYDALAGKRNHLYYPLQQLRYLTPGLREPGLQGATQFYDAVTDDARLVLRVLGEARADGGEALNGLRVVELLRELLIGSVIFLNDAPIAIQLVYRVEAPEWISVEYINGGVDPETREFSPGSVLSFLNTQSAWEHARALNKPLRFSFGRADREYKDRWCNPVPVFTV